MNTHYDKFLKSIANYSITYTEAREYSPLLNVVFEYSKLESDWDGYSAEPPTILTCINAYNFVTFIQQSKLVTPSIMLTGDGEISFFWKFNTTYIEVNIQNSDFSYIVVENKILKEVYDK